MTDPDPDPDSTTEGEEPREVTIDGELSGDLTGTIEGTVTFTPASSDPEPPDDDRFEFTGETLAVRSTADTPPMRYTFLVDEVSSAASLEDADSYEEQDDGRYRVEGAIGPRGTDRFDVHGRLADWSTEHLETGDTVPQAHYEITVDGEPRDLHTLLGEPAPRSGSGTPSPESGAGYPDPAAPDWFTQVAGFYAPPPDRVTEADCDVTVSSRDALLDAVKTEDCAVWVESDASIDLSGLENERIAAGVTIAGDRKPSDQQDGPLLHVDDNDAKNVFKTQGRDIRVTGLRLRGPNVEVLDAYNPETIRTFGLFYGDDGRFDNLEVYGWPFAGFCAGAKNYPCSHEFAYIHFHHNAMKGYGYGLELFNGFHEIHHCYFDYDRHSIAGFGRPENGYDAHHNVVGPHHMSHAFDMHALRQNVPNVDSWVAGGRTVVRENHFDFTHALSGYPQEAFKIRGVPDDGCEITENTFRHDEEPTAPTSNGDAYHQTNAGDSFQNLEARDNEFGVDLPFQVPERYRPEHY